MKGFGYNILRDKTVRPNAKRDRHKSCLLTPSRDVPRLVPSQAKGTPRPRSTYRAARRNLMRSFRQRAKA